MEGDLTAPEQATSRSTMRLQRPGGHLSRRCAACRNGRIGVAHGQEGGLNSGGDLPAGTDDPMPGAAWSGCRKSLHDYRIRVINEVFCFCF
jgi:hypothetical protein